ncbi:TPA: amidase [Legionella pneumophila]|uniref:Amidase (Enantiomer selective) n=2 Tax=Legionella pneumophila TaxID=446 RepID=Q5ZT10_LEGPH|nr:amidase [Legionella pneumophila]AAU28417.1 amidase (enantiomer selective) [Legionella pneumophila subsp. pneumophila str. Philadelphia 1]AEW52593.1 amidase (enantiomer selective) [Legionella pneumophila subsp. pneumophila ATCC 43290]AGH52821.1 Amidase [Legionella pneumophila subsp. pneumophila LPE509]AGN15275.1 amidase [Legionella pneumophila subsp. pneumophila str. Thunder Bay]AOU05305.1 amidase [Legionella pneumophila]
MDAIHLLSATEIIRRIKMKELSAAEVMVAHLNHIDKINPVINALTERIPPEECLKQAKEIDKSISSKKNLNKLMGLPVAIKDALYVKGLICSSACSGFYKGEKAVRDATLVSRLKKEGAIILGLTNVPELCRGGDSDNLIYGRTNNPYDLARTSGGSSGGSAALIAAGGVPFALGSDGGGSLMQPAHCCGIVALKPTHGHLPHTGSVGGDSYGLIGNLISFGPMARSVSDLRLGLSVLAGSDQYDPYTNPVPVMPAAPLKKLRVAYFTENGFTPVDAEIQNVVKSAALALQDDVAIVREVRPDCVSKAFDLHWELFLGGDRGAGFKTMLSELGVNNLSWELQEFLRQAEQTQFSVTQLHQRMREIDLFRLELALFMQDYDVLISPVFPTVAKPHGIGIKEISDFSYAMTHNLSGFPTISLRCGTSAEGLPINVLIAANRWKDTTSLAVAERVEQLMGGYKPPSLIHSLQ